METGYNLSNYKDVLRTLKKICEEEEDVRRKEVYICVISITTTFLGLIIYSIAKHKANASITECLVNTVTNSSVVTTLLCPLFSYIFLSYQADILSQRKSKLYQALINTFEDEVTPPSKYQSSQLKEEEIKKMIQELIKIKL